MAVWLSDSHEIGSGSRDTSGLVRGMIRTTVAMDLQSVESMP